MHQILLRRVTAYVRDNMQHTRTIDEAAKLEELGVDSMATIAILVMLEQEFELNVNRMTEATPPRTLEELVGIAVHALPDDVTSDCR